jgi:hypothetical protein
MDQAGVLTAAEAHSDTASDAVRAVINTEYLRFTDAELLSFAQTFETHARLVFTAQVRIAGEIDGRKMAAAHGASSTTALLGRQRAKATAEHRQPPHHPAGNMTTSGRNRCEVTLRSEQPEIQPFHRCKSH